MWQQHWGEIISLFLLLHMHRLLHVEQQGKRLVGKSRRFCFTEAEFGVHLGFLF